MIRFADPVLIEQMTLGEKVSASLFVTALGMLITFTALVVLWGITAFYSKVLRNAEMKKKAGAIQTVKEGAKEEAKEEIQAEVPDEDDLELVAIITAAIAASMGTCVQNIVVRNIVRVPDHTPVWGQISRLTQMQSRY